MPVIERGYSSKVTVKLNGGTNTATGGMIVRNVNLSKIEFSADAEKIMNIVGNLLSCLEYPLSAVQRTQVTTLEA